MLLLTDLPRGDLLGNAHQDSSTYTILAIWSAYISARLPVHQLQVTLSHRVSASGYQEHEHFFDGEPGLPGVSLNARAFQQP